MAPKFHYSSYWCSWSRVLTEGRPTGKYYTTLRSFFLGDKTTIKPDPTHYPVLRRMGLLSWSGSPLMIRSTQSQHITQLGRAVIEGPTVEVNLTPISWATARNNEVWVDEVAGIRIRAHGTTPSPGDVFTYELPNVVGNTMMKHLSPVLLDRLLYEDFLSQINWDRYTQISNGGADLNDCLLAEYDADKDFGRKYIEVISLVRIGVLGQEEIPVSFNGRDTEYWHWPVLQPNKLPEWAKETYAKHGEVRL